MAKLTIDVCDHCHSSRVNLSISEDQKHALCPDCAASLFNSWLAGRGREAATSAPPTKCVFCNVSETTATLVGIDNSPTEEGAYACVECLAKISSRKKYRLMDP